MTVSAFHSRHHGKEDNRKKNRKRKKKEGVDVGNHEGGKETDAGVVSKKSRMERKLMEG